MLITKASFLFSEINRVSNKEYATMIIEGELIYDSPFKTRTYKIKENNIIEHYIQRTDLKYINENDRLELSGVYVLIGHIDGISAPKVYIGQTMNVRRRLGEHMSHKEFWEHALVFQTIEEQYNVLQVMYLEYALVREMLEHGNVQMLENSQIPPKQYMSMADEMCMLNTVKDIKILMEYSGLDFFKVRKMDLTEEYKNNKGTGNTIMDSISRRMIKDMQISNNKVNNDVYMDSDDDYEAEDAVTYTFSSSKYYAEVIPVGARFMLMPLGHVIYRSAEEFKKLPVSVRSHIDMITGNISKDLYFDTLEEVAYVVTGVANSLLATTNYKKF